jgi:iron complex outermembrane receptor protein
MAVGGVRGLLGSWSYDASAEWGRNVLDMDIFDTHNVSLGPCVDSPCAPGEDGMLGTADDPGVPNKTDVYAGTLELNQVIAAFDVNREIDIGTAAPLNIALGTAFRLDNFQIIAGETASWVNGWHPDRAGGIAPPGSQVFTGFRPDQAVDESRTNVGIYADVEAGVTSMLRLAAAGRLERYSDFGETLTGKLAARLQPAEQFVLRAAVSTGFRAPNINQSYYTHVSTGFRNDGTGNQVAYEIGELPVESPEARALGAQPLREETSVNLSGGVAFSPAENLTFTIDGYRIDIDDRIILTGSLSGPTVEQLLAAYGAPTVKFFTNSIDTRTTGFDVTARYRHLLREDRYLEAIVQYNRNELEVTGIAVPAVIEELRDQVFTSADEYLIENGRPKDRATLRARYHHGPFTIAAAGNHYGEQTFLLQEDPDVFQDNGPHFVLDAETAFRIRDGFEISVGAENLLDRNPPARPADFSFLGIFPYFSSSGLHINGRYVYAQVRVRT